MDWNDRAGIIELVKASVSKAEVLRKMGKSDKSSRNRLLLQEIMDDHNIVYNGENSDKVDYPRLLPNIVDNCSCWSDVVREVGLLPRGGNISTIRKWVTKLGLNISHFNSNGAKARGNKTRSIEDMCTVDSKVSQHVLKSKLRNGNIIPYKCQLCGIGDTWNGLPLVLQLDHINGICTDNRLINLRFLCPNCHTQTPTWGRK